jgi:Ca-activated chloride channel family protein
MSGAGELQFRFVHAWALVLLLGAVIWLGWRYRRDGLRGSPLTLLYSDIRLMSGLPVGWRVRLRRLPDVLKGIVWVLLVLALARPQIGNARELLRGEGIDIVLALDISGSMAALDFQPGTRLDAAKRVIMDFIAGRQFDRIGLVVFARSAYQQAPLTLDYDVLSRLLEQVRIVNEIVDASGQPVLLDGTAIGLGVASAGTMLRDSSAPSKVIVLLTDGDNNAALDPLTAADAVGALGVRVYTIGMGTSGQVPIPDNSGNIVYTESDLDEPTLQEIASRSGGLYFRAEDPAGLQSIYDSIDRLERARVERQVFIPWQDVAWPLIIGGLILLLIERLLRDTLLQTIP